MKRVIKFLISASLLSLTANAKEPVDIRHALSSIVNHAFAAQAKQDHVIALAARNKMLSQKMAKDAVMIRYNMNKKASHDDLIVSAQAFDAVLKGLRQGDSLLHISKATDAKVLEHLAQVEAAWKPFYADIKKLQNDGAINRDAYDDIVANNEKLLRLSHKLTQTLKSKSKISTTFNKVVEHSLKIADRQRMLSQKMFKEKLLLFYHEDDEANRPRLKGSIILFENGLQGLIKGEKRRGLVKIANKKIQVPLKKTWALWEKSQSIYRKRTISKEELKQLKTYEPLLLKHSEEIVRDIEKSLDI